MKSFTTGSHQEPRISTEEIVFEHDGRQVTARPPTAAQYALFQAAYQSIDGDVAQVADVVNFFFVLFSGSDFDYFKERLFDPDDSFDLGGEGGMASIIVTLLGVWLSEAIPVEDVALSH